MIKSIRITNFKSLRDVYVEFGRITVLIGRSGSGKSNFVNAIAFLRDCLVKKQEAIHRWGGARRLLCATAQMPQDNNRLEMIFEVRFDVPGSETEFVYELCLASGKNSPNQLSIFRETLTHNGTTVFRRELNKWLIEPAVIPLPQPNPLGLEVANGIPEVGLAYLVLTVGIGCYDFGGDVLIGPRNAGQDAGLADNASNYLECFETINRNLQDSSGQKEIVAALRQLNPALRGIQVVMPGRDHVIVSLQAGEKSLRLTLAQESEGFRRFLAHLIAIYQVPSKQLLIFEEPEKGLYPGALSALADQLRACAMGQRGQIILTTHNPMLLDHFGPEEIRVVEIENFETKIGPISLPQFESLREHLMSTGDLLTVDPARLASNDNGLK